MVPNHMGIDSHWVIEHPEWFLSLPEPPYPGYTFGGENLAEDDRVEIRLEDHYWDNSDAAVVFERRDRRSGERRYIYHGNDGTSFPWNDTAQLDFSREDVREQVIRTIVDVAEPNSAVHYDPETRSLVAVFPNTPPPGTEDRLVVTYTEGDPDIIEIHYG